MIKVLIADDEQRVRIYMQRVLDWNALGFEIIGAAGNGEQALVMLEEGKPDIALLDINMPRMNGIQFTEQLKEISPDTRVIFITGYSEFEYTKKAIQLGVADYLLKPFSKEELLEILLRLKEEIQAQQEKQKIYRQERRILRDELLRKLIRVETEDTEEYQEKLEQLSVNISAASFRISIVELDREKEAPWKEKDRDLWRFGIMNVLEELTQEKEGEQYLFTNHTGDVVAFSAGEQAFIEELPKIMEELLEQVKKLMGLSITVGIGRSVGSLEEIPESYRSALLCLQDKFVGGGGRIINYEEYTAHGRRADFYRMELNEQLLAGLRRNDKEHVTKLLCQAEKEMAENHYSADYVTAAIMGMLSVCLSYIVEMRGDIREILNADFSPYQELGQMESMEESFAWLDQIFRKTAEHFYRPHSRRVDEIIQEVEAYISQHYGDFELTVEDVADSVFLDISYIRKIFAKHKNCTVQEQITSVRMKAAKEFLEKGSLSISEVSERCGYIDVGYFGRCFKKYYHMTPKQYRDQI